MIYWFVVILKARFGKMAAQSEPKVAEIPKGRPKSGRIWKSEGLKKSDMLLVPSLHSTWNDKIRKRAERKSVKSFERELKEAAKKQREERKRLIEERRKRREENEKKSQIVQVITNTTKIKRMKKKQLRQIKKQ